MTARLDCSSHTLFTGERWKRPPECSLLQRQHGRDLVQLDAAGAGALPRAP